MFNFLKPNVEKLKERRDVKGLIKALSHKDVTIRVEAARALADVGDPSAVEALTEALRDDSTDVRKAAVKALARIADERAVDALAKALKDESLDVRVEAAKALAEIGQKKTKEIVETISGILDVPKDVAAKILEDNRLMDKAKEKFKDFIRK
ncbi:HEAT repeat domain-containing protein [Archaeoglobus veneficus]|uniref:PBS lyase HEAT domain protein repeat-containing protein n=1 Tax=Archaeoglobus veneficus (strain DSM 11195 / SNP6) TaxID=693661 RepID=F2KMS9_ARCVS|nr:HEAT repeat domain-containing protein [Archaeoglobus veneficus]AEA46103.1 PBS lyase HEAT domain protein repeat-containing protein [Archaeoglobus veneficus SNP6]